MTVHDIMSELARVKSMPQLQTLKRALGIHSGRMAIGTAGERATSPAVIPATRYSITFVEQKKQEGL